MPVAPFRMKLIQAELIAPEVKHFAFQRTDNQPLSFIAGQFITIHFEQAGKTYRRSYSVATIPGSSNLIEFAAGYVSGGPASELLFHLEPGDELTVTGPFGRLILKDEDANKRYIFVATSTGVTPFLAMRQALQARLANSQLQAVLLEGVRTRNDLLYAREFLALAEAYPNFTFSAHYSREQLTDAKPFEAEGYVQEAFPQLNLNPDEDIIYLCGNPGMIDEAFAQLTALGFASKDVRREKYISSN